MKLFAETYLWRRKNSVKVRKSLASGCRSVGILTEFSNIVRWGIFVQSGSCLWKDWSDIHEKCIADVCLDKEVSTKL